jgi:hypothetical protein
MTWASLVNTHHLGEWDVTSLGNNREVSPGQNHQRAAKASVRVAAGKGDGKVMWLEGLERTEVKEEGSVPAAEGATREVTIEVGRLAALTAAFSLLLANQVVQTSQEEGG